MWVDKGSDNVSTFFTAYKHHSLRILKHHSGPTNTKCTTNLVRISVKNWLLFELQFAWMLTITPYMHCTMVIAVYFTKNKIIYTCCDLLQDMKMFKHNCRLVAYIKKRQENDSNEQSVCGKNTVTHQCAPCSTGKFHHRQTPSSELQQGQAELIAPKILCGYCYQPRTSTLYLHSDRQWALGGD